MATNLVNNVKESLEEFPVNLVVGWLDSTILALLWIRGHGKFKFVENRVRKVQGATLNGDM